MSLQKFLFLIPSFAIGTFVGMLEFNLLERQIRHPRRWLSATLLAGLLVMATAGALFMYLADEIGEQARLTQVDLAVAQFFHDHGTLWAVRLFEAITFFGNASTLCVIGLVTALVLAFQRRWSLLLGWAVALIGAGELNVILKGIFRRLRPQLPDPLGDAVGLEFSQRARHGIVSSPMDFWLTYLPGYLGPIFHRRTAVAVLAVLVLLIGFSRIYLGAHYLSDVVGGYAGAAVWLTFCILVADRTQRR